VVDVHDELNRLILRQRWIKWSLKNHRPGDYNLKRGRHIMLSRRLTAWRPTWCQRNNVEREVLEDLE
jgi:hypothetical protein